MRAKPRICTLFCIPIFLSAAVSSLAAQESGPGPLPSQSNAKSEQDPFAPNDRDVSDPFDDLDVAKANDKNRMALMLNGTPDLVLKAAFSKLESEIDLQVGELVSGQDQLIEIQLSNELGIEVSFGDIAASLGCLGGLPEDLKLKAKDVLPVRVRFRVPRHEEKFSKSITLVDSSSSTRLRLNLVGQSKDAIVLARSIFPINKSGRITVETSIAFPFGHSTDKLRFRCSGKEVAGWRVIPGENNDAKLFIDIIASEKDELSSKSLFLAIDEDDKVIGEVPIEFRRGYKPIARPSTVLIRLNGDNLHGRVLVQLSGLTSKGQKTSANLIGRATNLDTDEEFEFDVKGTLNYAGEMLTIADLEIANARIKDSVGQLELSVEFIAGETVFSVPMKIFK